MIFEHRFALALVLSVSALACKGPDRGASTMTTGAQGAEPLGANDAAINAIANARCDREVACKMVGPNQAYETREACVIDLASRGRNDLSTSECPSGVSSSELEKCVGAIRGDKCGTPIDTATHLASCRATSLCSR